MKGIRDRVAVVTGAAQGIGLAVSRRLAQEGAQVILADSNQETLGSAIALLNRESRAFRLHHLSLDVRDEQRVDSCLETLSETVGAPQILVNNAGILRDGWIDDLSQEQWQDVLDVHLTGAFNCSRALIPGMKAAGYGRIVNISSRAWQGNPGQCNYSAAKAGLVGLTRALALELVSFGINVNAVAPGLIETPMTASLRPHVRRRLLAAQPGGRMGTPGEVASLVAFLASSEASFVTGQVVAICGGKSLGLGGVA